MYFHCIEPVTWYASADCYTTYLHGLIYTGLIKGNKNSRCGSSLCGPRVWRVASLGNFTRRASITRFYISSLPPHPHSYSILSPHFFPAHSFTHALFTIHYLDQWYGGVWLPKTVSRVGFYHPLLHSSPHKLSLPTHTLILHSHLAFTLRLPSRSSTDLPPYTVLSPTSRSYLYSLHSPGRGCGRGWLLQW